MTWAEEIVLEMALQIVKAMDRRVMLGLPAIPKPGKHRRPRIQKKRRRIGGIQGGPG